LQIDSCIIELQKLHMFDVVGAISTSYRIVNCHLVIARSLIGEDVVGVVSRIGDGIDVLPAVDAIIALARGN
jgi:hypothetical protein